MEKNEPKIGYLRNRLSTKFLTAAHITVPVFLLKTVSIYLFINTLKPIRQLSTNTKVTKKTKPLEVCYL
mgnify:CR=1